MRESLKLLMELQNLDLVIDDLKVQKEEIPEKIKGMQEQYKIDVEKMEEDKNSLSYLQVDKKNKEIELGSEEEAIKKHQKELNSIKKNEAYKSMLKQIEDANRKKQQLEDEILEIMQKNEDLKKEFESRKMQIEQGKKTMDEEINSLNKEVKHLSEKMEELIQKRSFYTGNIPKEYLQTYEKMRGNKGGVVVVSINIDNCGGCHLSVLPQSINEAMKDKELVLCENCGRILYWKE